MAEGKGFVPYSCAFCYNYENSIGFKPEDCVHKHSSTCFHCNKSIPCSTSASDPHISLCNSCMASYTRCELCNSLVNSEEVEIINNLRVCIPCTKYGV